jgi:V/A-type H+-transporting ATPase subunit D
VIRPPPGRAGRIWLERRLEVARRGVDVLDQKRQTLLREQQLLVRRLDETGAEWERRAADARTWNDRALAIAGPRRLRLAALHGSGPARVRVEWRRAVGTPFPAEASVTASSPVDLVALGGGASVALAASAHSQALAAGAVHAAVRAAYEAITAELVATTRRLRAIERRWIPEHEAALHRLELALEERELEDAVRARWALERRQRAPDCGLSVGGAGRAAAGA